MTSAPAIGFEYRPSRWLPRLLGAMAVLATLAVVLSGLPGWLKLPLVVLVALLVFRAVRRWSASPVRAAGWSGEGGWSLRLADRSDAPAVLASFRVLGACILLRLRAAPLGEQVLLLAPDNSDADIRRRLRMRLAVVQAGGAAPRA
ncbi:protein YgfX [Rhodanobacter aciditrophus]|uniref:protein YgfX n=1 Tax=Rhodanobacter aciditrophus TaxID=1623218 RepID=UPI003CE93AA3